MRKAIIIIFVAVAVCGCKTKEYIPVVEHLTDTLRVVQHHRDSIYLHDSTFVKEYIQGDTVRVITEMWHTKFRDRLKTDTIYRHLNERDTLRRLIEEYRENRTLGNVLASVETLLDIDAQEKATRDFEAWEQLIKKNEN